LIKEKGVWYAKNKILPASSQYQSEYNCSPDQINGHYVSVSTPIANEISDSTLPLPPLPLQSKVIHIPYFISYSHGSITIVQMEICEK